jgi:phage regulator Rha-like protein
MNDLELIELVVDRGEIFVDSRLLAEPLDIRHRNILALIRTHQEDFEALGFVAFKTEGIQTEKGERAHIYCLLNEDQVYMLLTLVRNSPKAVKLKRRMVISFRNYRRTSADRDRARVEGKKVRMLETNDISKLVDYAKAGGSANADKYYMVVTKLTNNLLGIPAGARDNLDASTLQKISVAEMVVGIAIRDGMSAGLTYKDVYQVVKNRVNDLGPILVNPKLLT